MHGFALRFSPKLALAIVSAVLVSGCGGSGGGGGASGEPVVFNEPVLISNSVLMKGFSSDLRLVGVPVLNGAGQNAGYYFASPASTAQALGPTGDGLGNDVPMSVNYLGQIVGYETPGSKTSALYWSSPAATPFSLPIPATATSATPLSINNNGEIVGTMVTGGLTQACYWRNAGTAAVVLPASPAVAFNPGTVAINNRSQICAASATGSAVWSSPTAQPTALVATKGTGASYAVAISNYGVAGFVGTGTTSNTFAVWSSPGFGETALSGTAGNTAGVTALNDSGEIGGNLAGAAIWPAPFAGAELVNNYIPTPMASGVLNNVFCISDDGTVVTAGADPNSGNPVYYYATPK